MGSGDQIQVVKLAEQAFLPAELPPLIVIDVDVMLTPICILCIWAPIALKANAQWLLNMSE